MDIKQATERYATWLGDQLKIVKTDLDKRRDH